MKIQVILMRCSGGYTGIIITKDSPPRLLRGIFYWRDNMTIEKIIAQDIEEGYDSGFYPCEWSVFMEKPEFYEDVADMVSQGIMEGRLPCNWKVTIYE